MQKAVLILDMPKKCKKCRFKDTNHHLEDICLCKTEKDKDGGEYFKEIVDLKTKPDWCPLKPMPEKMHVCGKYPQEDKIVPSYKIGYNACIDELLKGEEG